MGYTDKIFPDSATTNRRTRSRDKAREAPRRTPCMAKIPFDAGTRSGANQIAPDLQITIFNQYIDFIFLDIAGSARPVFREAALTRKAGRRFACQGLTPDNPRWLVLRIERCSAPFPFDRVIVDRDSKAGRRWKFRIS